MLTVKPRDGGFGAEITGVDLARGLDADTAAAVRAAWVRHQVVWFPDQPLDHDALERFTRCFGEFGDEPYVAPVPGHEHILEVRREPDEKPAPFGAAWHSDWSFMTSPPAATILHAKVVPPQGGDTLYADGCAAFESLPAAEQRELSGLTALHSARRPYSPQGFEAGGGRARAMKILPSERAYEITEHPLVRTHPESGRKVLWINAVYTVGIKELADDEAGALLERLFALSVEERFVYRHRWAPDMLTMWDNRSVQHCAQGGYDGFRRVMHRTTVAGDRPYQ